MAGLMVLAGSLGFAVPEDPSTPSTGLATQLSEILARKAKATTTAQMDAYQQKAIALIKDKPLELSLPVEEVSAITFNKESQHSIEGTSTGLSVRVEVYVKDRDKALALNKGDQIQVKGTGHAVLFGKVDVLVVKDASILSATPGTAAAPAVNMALFSLTDVPGDITVATINALFMERQKLTTRAQVFESQEALSKAAKGRILKASVTVTDVKAGIFRGAEVMSIEALNAEPPFRMSFYAKDKDKALELNAGDEVTVAGPLLGIELGKSGKDGYAIVESAEILETKPKAAPAQP
jgi:hypothetical protein